MNTLLELFNLAPTLDNQKLVIFFLSIVILPISYYFSRKMGGKKWLNDHLLDTGQGGSFFKGIYYFVLMLIWGIICFISGLLFLYSLVGCSSTKSITSVSSEFIGGDLKITYDKNGEFESISSKATAQVSNTLPNAKDQAVTIATLKARRQISEFLKVDIQSERFLVTISKSLQETNMTNQMGDNKEGAKIAYNLRESIRQRSSSILQGTYLQSESFNSDTNLVTVVISAGKKESKLVKDVKKSVGQ
jgi:hypothetical protein